MITDLKEKKSKMSSISSRKRVRYSFDVHFVRIEEKEAFLEKCKTVHQRLTPAGSPFGQLQFVNIGWVHQ